MSGDDGSRKMVGKQGRDKRFLANMQSALTTVGINNTTPSRKEARILQNSSLPDDETATLTEMLKQIRITDEDHSLSLADLRVYLLRRIDQLTEDEFAQLATVLCEMALEQTSTYFVLDISTELIEHRHFQFAMAEELKKFTVKYLDREDEKFDSLPSVLAQFMVNRWPRKFNRTIESSNLILFTIFNTIVGWIKFVNSQCKKNDSQEQTEVDSDDKDANLQLFLRCTEGMLAYCNTGQRHLWLSYPELFDDIYKTSVELLVGNINLSRFGGEGGRRRFQQIQVCEIVTSEPLQANEQMVPGKHSQVFYSGHSDLRAKMCARILPFPNDDQILMCFFSLITNFS